MIKARTSAVPVICVFYLVAFQSLSTLLIPSGNSWQQKRYNAKKLFIYS
jgi:hypothetical protein